MVGKVEEVELRPELAMVATPFLLDPRQILLVDRLRKLEVVVEAVLDRRADGDLHARVETAHRLGKQMRRRVPEYGESIRIVLVPGRQDLNRLAVLER